MLNEKFDFTNVYPKYMRLESWLIKDYRMSLILI